MSQKTQPRTISALRPTSNEERRSPLTPESVKQLISMQYSCLVPAGLGARAGWSDDDFAAAGASVVTDDDAAQADIVLCVEPPASSTIASLAVGSTLIGLLDPFKGADRFDAACAAGVSSISLELIPRSTIAQSMDALSSQASLAGYAAVVMAASRLPRVLPMMSTPAGTIPPARVLVVGTGVAGLQAIATAVRLGARVTAYDVRPAAKEQVESLGAKFARIEITSAGETDNGYAAEQTEDLLARQRMALTKLCHESDIIITTAQVFGKPAQTILERSMLAGMKAGSVIVDAAIGTGGNADFSEPGMDVAIDGINVIANVFVPSAVAHEASRMLASNIVSLLRHLADEEGSLVLDPEHNEILRSVLVTHKHELLATAATKPMINGGARS